MTYKGGRPQNLIWEKFLRVTKEGKTTAKCLRCSHEMANSVERMQKHWLTKVVVLYKLQNIFTMYQTCTKQHTVGQEQTLTDGFS